MGKDAKLRLGSRIVVLILKDAEQLCPNGGRRCLEVDGVVRLLIDRRTFGEFLSDEREELVVGEIAKEWAFLPFGE